MNQLEMKLNQLGGRGITFQQLMSIGIKVLAMTTPCSSFIGMWKGQKIYASHHYPTNTWEIEKA